MPCLAFVNSWFTAPPYIRSRCFARGSEEARKRGSEVVFYYIFFLTMNIVKVEVCKGLSSKS